MAMNLCIFQGNLTKDPTVTNGNKANGEPYTKATFTLGVDRIGAKDVSDYPEFFCFGGAAEFVEKNLKKGSRVIVESEYQSGSYTNKDGVKVYTSNFRATNIRFS